MKQDEKIVFMVSADQGQETPLILLGVPAGAWEYMKDGKTHTFDLRNAGINCKLVIFGAPSHAAALKTLEEAAAKSGIAISDERGKDWGLPK